MNKILYVKHSLTLVICSHSDHFIFTFYSPGQDKKIRTSDHITQLKRNQIIQQNLILALKQSSHYGLPAAAHLYRTLSLLITINPSRIRDHVNWSQSYFIHPDRNKIILQIELLQSTNSFVIVCRHRPSKHFKPNQTWKRRSLYLSIEMSSGEISSNAQMTIAKNNPS